MKRDRDKATKGDSRQRIIDAATSLFTIKPFSELSVEEIARQAGVAHGLVFHYFGTKARLYEELSQIAADRLDEIHRQAAQGESDPNRRLIAFLESHMRTVEARRVDYIFRARGGTSPAVQAIWERSRRNAIVLVLAFFGIDTPSEPVVVAVRAWLGYFDELVLAWMQDGTIPRAGVLEATFRTFAPAMQNARLLGAVDAPTLIADYA